MKITGFGTGVEFGVYVPPPSVTSERSERSMPNTLLEPSNENADPEELVAVTTDNHLADP